MFTVRRARSADIPALEALIARSGRELSVGYYSTVQADAITRYVFGVDPQLIAEEPHCVIEGARGTGAGGGWSRRRTLFGADRTKASEDPLLDAATEPA